MFNSDQVEEYPLDSRIKKSLLDSSKMLGCRLSEFEVIDFCKKPSRLDSYWADFAWESEENLRIHLEFEKRQAYLKQTFNNKQANIPVRWGKELPPALQFSPEGICPLTQQQARQLVQQFSKLPPLPFPEGGETWGGISLEITKPFLIPGFSYANREKILVSMGLETPQRPKEYEIRDDVSILRFRSINNDFIVDFLIKNKVANNKVKLVITGDSNRELINEERNLVYRDERWRFRYVLPVSIVSQVRNINITIFGPEGE